MQTKRCAPRISVDFAAAFSHGENFSFGTVSNISSSGLFLQTRKLLPVDTELCLRLRLPDDKEIMELQARVVWSKPEKPQSPAGMGLEFINLAYGSWNKLFNFLYLNLPDCCLRQAEPVISAGYTG